MKDKREIRHLYNLMQEELSSIISKKYKYKEITEKCNESEELLRKSISKEDYKLFEDFVDNFVQLMDYQAGESFIAGFLKANKYRDESIR